MDGSPPGSSVYGILQARILEWVAISSPRGSSLTQGPNPGLPHRRQIPYHLSHQESPKFNDLEKKKATVIIFHNSVSQNYGQSTAWLLGQSSPKQKLSEFLSI